MKRDHMFREYHCVVEDFIDIFIRTITVYSSILLKIIPHTQMKYILSG